MKIGACGIACEKCPRTVANTCPSGGAGCIPKDDPFCRMADRAFSKGVKLCLECKEFQCAIIKAGPISYRFCQCISGKAG